MLSKSTSRIGRPEDGWGAGFLPASRDAQPVSTARSDPRTAGPTPNVRGRHQAGTGEAPSPGTAELGTGPRAATTNTDGTDRAPETRLGPVASWLVTPTASKLRGHPPGLRSDGYQWAQGLLRGDKGWVSDAGAHQAGTIRMS